MAAMRLRQAHAIIETARALEPVGFDGMHPVDHDQYNLVVERTTDYLTGIAEFNDPDSEGLNTRSYTLDIFPGPGEFDITVRLQFGYRPDRPALLDETFVVFEPQDDGESYLFNEGVSSMIAGRVEAAVREHEKLYEAAYASRTARG